MNKLKSQDAFSVRLIQLLVRLNRGLPEAADMVASGLAFFITADEARAETLFCVPWSLPSQGITGDLGGLLFKRTNGDYNLP